MLMIVTYAREHLFTLRTKISTDAQTNNARLRDGRISTFVSATFTYRLKSATLWMAKIMTK